MKEISKKTGLDLTNLSKAFDFLPYPFVLSEMRDNVQRNIYINQKFQEEIGYNIDEIKTIDEWFLRAYPDPAYRNETKEEWFRREQAARLSNQDFLVLPSKLYTKKGEYRWYEIKSSFRGTIHFVAFINIHEGITATEELSRLNENKNRLLSTLSHDLRAPLSSLHGALGLMSLDSMTESEKYDILQKISNQVFRVGEFLDTTLHWTKVNFQETIINHQIFDLKTIVENILSLYATSWIGKKIQLNVALEKKDGVYGDPGIFSIVFRNLVSNAIKFTPINGTIRVYDCFKDDKYALAIENSGNGISQKKISEILSGNPVSEPGTSGERGMGLGLNLSIQLLRKSGGHLEIENLENNNAVFKIVI